MRVANRSAGAAALLIGLLLLQIFGGLLSTLQILDSTSESKFINSSLTDNGDGTWTVENFKSAVDSKDRSRCGALAPPEGLYLMEVKY